MSAKRIRLCVGEPGGNRSAVWSIAWRKSDVYLIATEAAGAAKLSLHLRTGEFSWGYVREYFQAREREIGHPTRHIMRWTRPPEYEPGLTLPFRIYVANEALRPQPNLPTNKEIRWLKPRLGTAVGFFCVIAAPSVATDPYTELDELDLLHHITLPDHSETLFLYAHYVDAEKVSVSANAGIIGFTLNDPSYAVRPNDRIYALMDKQEPVTGSWNFIEVPNYVLNLSGR